MDIIVGGRQAGKTTVAVKMVKANHGILVVNDQHMKDWVSEQFQLEPRRIITTDTLLAGVLRGSRPNQNIAIDNVDIFLSRLLRIAPRLITLGGDVTLLHGGNGEEKNDEGCDPSGAAKSPT